MDRRDRRWKDSHRLTELATLLDAGIPPQQALGRVLPRARLPQGQPLSRWLHHNGWLRADDRLRLEMAEQSGRTPEALRELAQSLADRQSRLRQLRTRLGLSWLFLGVGLLAGLALATASPSASPASWLAAALPGLLPAIGMVLLAFRITGLGSLQLARFHWRTSPGGGFLRPVFEERFCSLLAEQLASGMDAARALQSLATLFGDRDGTLTRAAHQVSKGLSLHVALTDAGWRGSPEVLGALRSGETSGRLPDSLQHQGLLLRQALKVRLAMLDQWLPRLVQLTAIVTAASLVGLARG